MTKQDFISATCSALGRRVDLRSASAAIRLLTDILATEPQRPSEPEPEDPERWDGQNYKNPERTPN